MTMEKSGNDYCPDCKEIIWDSESTEVNVTYLSCSCGTRCFECGDIFTEDDICDVCTYDYNLQSGIAAKEFYAECKREEQMFD